MAFRAAMTGHQVFSTLHTNSAIGAIPRLLDIGIRPDIMADNIIGIMAQRLVRKLCPECRQPYEPGDLERRLLGIKAGGRVPTVYQAGDGCAVCDQQAYKGRMALLEVLRMDSELDEMIVRGASKRALMKLALEKGFRPLSEAAIKRVLEGSTSLDEVSRVVDLSQRLN